MLNYKTGLCFIFFFIGLVFWGCNKEDSKAALVMKHYDHNIRFSTSQKDYYLPYAVYYKYIQTFRNFDKNAEYSPEILETLSTDYIRSAIQEINSIYLRSDNLSMNVQFPNQDIYDEYLAIFKISPLVSRDDFARILKFEYIVTITATNALITTDNYCHVFNERSDIFEYKGQACYYLDRENRDYFLGDAFTIDMDAVAAWVNGEKWNDLDSTIIRKDGNLFIYTFDPTQ